MSVDAFKSQQESLLDIAATNLEVASGVIRLTKSRDIGERGLNGAVFWVQQCVELCLKHCIEMQGTSYSCTQDIVVLRDEAIRAGVKLSDRATVFLHLRADMVTEFATQTRDVKGYRVSLVELTEVMEEAVFLLRELQRSDQCSSGSVGRVRLE